MLIVHHELLDDVYLLVLAPASASASETELAHHLRCAVQSRKLAVWIDCRLLDTMSATAMRLLSACHHRLRQRGAQLVRCRVPAALAQQLRQRCAGPDSDLHLVDSLDEAAAHLYAPLAALPPAYSAGPGSAPGQPLPGPPGAA